MENVHLIFIECEDISIVQFPYLSGWGRVGVWPDKMKIKLNSTLGKVEVRVELGNTTKIRLVRGH